MSRMHAGLVAFALTLAVPGGALAAPGPDSTAVVYRTGDAEGMALALAYADARDVPPSQVCGVDPPAGDDMTLADFRAHVEVPLAACLDAAGVAARIEALVVVKGVPLRVVVPAASGDQTVSTTAALAVSGSTRMSDSMPLVGLPPGRVSSCSGTPCVSAAWDNPYNAGPFRAGLTFDYAGVHYTPRLVTRLDGRTYADAMKLVTSALDAERMGGARGTFLLMDGADSARGALDTQYAAVLSGLAARGFTDAREAPFDADLTGQSLAALFVGTDHMGMTIEGSTYLPGAIVDNLTSFGAVPVNFAASGESQVSIARWVAMGVTGVHGTVDEPLNNCFPSRAVLLDWVSGGTLGESFFRRLPFTYWKNLVVGDVMAAPYAARPVVTLTGVTGGATVSAASVHASATDAHGIASIVVYVDGVERARVDDGSTSLELCLDALTPGHVAQVLAVAQAANDLAPDAYWQTKGWTRLDVVGATPAVTGCAAPDAGTGADAGAATDAGAYADAGADAGAVHASSGCGCVVARGDARGGLVVVALVALVALGRRPRARAAA